MEIQLQELIEQIRKEGVAAAESEARSILDAANADAEKIIADAKAQADKILANARLENERMLKSSEEAIRQAGRNLLISFRESVARELRAITEAEVCAVYSSKSLSELILKIVEVWASKPDAENLSVVMSEGDLTELESYLLTELNTRMINGVLLKPSNNFDGGFRIAANNGSAYYDYSTEAVVDMLSNYLSPKLYGLLKEAK